MEPLLLPAEGMAFDYRSSCESPTDLCPEATEARSNTRQENSFLFTYKLRRANVIFHRVGDAGKDCPIVSTSTRRCFHHSALPSSPHFRRSLGINNLRTHVRVTCPQVLCFDIDHKNRGRGSSPVSQPGPASASCQLPTANRPATGRQPHTANRNPQTPSFHNDARGAPPNPFRMITMTKHPGGTPTRNAPPPKNHLNSGERH